MRRSLSEEADQLCFQYSTLHVCATNWCVYRVRRPCTYFAENVWVHIGNVPKMPPSTPTVCIVLRKIHKWWQNTLLSTRQRICPSGSKERFYTVSEVCKKRSEFATVTQMFSTKEVMKKYEFQYVLQKACVKDVESLRWKGTAGTHQHCTEDVSVKTIV